MHFVKNFKILNVKDAATAAASNITDASVVDTKGFDGCVFIAKLGTSAANNGLKVQQDTASGFGTGADLASSQQLLDGTSKIAVVDVHRPLERYLKPIIVRGTSSTLDSCIAILYRGRNKPVTEDTAVSAKVIVSPSEGTA